MVTELFGPHVNCYNGENSRKLCTPAALEIKTKGQRSSSTSMNLKIPVRVQGILPWRTTIAYIQELLPSFLSRHTLCNAKNTLRAVHTHSLQCNYTLRAMQKTHSVQCTHTPCNATTHSVQCKKHTPCSAQTLPAMQLHTACNATTHSVQCKTHSMQSTTYNATTHFVQYNNTLCAMQQHTPCNATTHSVQCTHTLHAMHTPSVQCNCKSLTPETLPGHRILGQSPMITC
uniref:Uncharacterized protein n=1 Tax=Podarcis muralis TaxID=64176 RepID=A0A670IG16_PODMU